MSALVAVDRQEELGRWYLRLRGEEKDFVTVWLTIRQRTLHHETQVMPAPEVNAGETFEYLLKKNSDLHQMRFALGAEDAVYLVGEVPVVAVTEDELDRIVGSSLGYVDAFFPTAMSIGFAGRYRRRTN
jgi:Putative bacterial sensory transduction regulator